MASQNALVPSAQFRKKLRQRGGEVVSRCYQCATCSTACDLATPDRPFPRKQMLEAQWGLSERLMADPALWLCHQCNDCSARCPRNARPGDVMAVLRALVVETLAAPKFMGPLVGNAARTWPLLIGVPILFWAALLFGFGERVPANLHAYEEFVPHVYIYTVYFTVSAWVVGAFWLGGKRFWDLIGQGETRRGSFWRALWLTLVDIAVHRRFGRCGEAKPRKWAHFALMWGFVGAAIASALIIVYMYGLNEPLPLPQTNISKLIGNGSAVLLVVGSLMLLSGRLEDKDRVGRTNAFDAFFLGVVLLVTFTGVLTELGRYVMSPTIACAIYVVHLGSVLCL
ncbi:MAG: quinone-interacting membrane-bound oxidoreductase complex subunit QmoC, partial [Deltaproteobacteria bacterium]|nr:quinone-interacting membrane-bound oxidoreductase complex subunit QmoC [Deltaproteobacteria bacterium]MBW2531373.1 quinone-interacting membrane-bound oxidoreductase complex subunit QmoC [Deltaproteobacteria bacterium]